MNPYEYETTLDCRDDTRAVGGGGGGSMTPRHPPTSSQQNTLHHQNQQNLQLQQQLQQQQQPDSQSSYYDYEYQHLPHRIGGSGVVGTDNPPSSTSTAARTHGRQGFLLEGVTPSAPPDVPPRNPTMSRMNNGRLVPANPNDLGVDFEPSCLVRTPSGNVYIPSGNLNMNKGSPIDYKSGSACSTPTKDTLKGYERSANQCLGPVLPPRSVMSGIPSHHYSAPMNFRKDLAARCSAKCIAIVSVSVFVAMCVLLIFLTGFGVLHWSPSAPCTVLVGNEASEVTAAKSTNTDLSKLHNSSLRSKTGQPTMVTTATSSLSSSQAAASSSAFQSTSASSVAMGSAAATSTSSSSSSTSLSSPLANANNGEINIKQKLKLNKKQKDENYNYDDVDSKNKDKENSYLQQQQLYLEKQKQRQRYRRSLSAKSFEHLITKKGGVTENEDDVTGDGDMGSTNKKDLTNAKTFNDNNGNMMTTTEDEKQQKTEEDKDEEEEKVVLMAKSNYDNKFMNEQQQQHYAATTTTSIFITSSTTSDELLSSSSSLSSSLSSYDLKDDDKTLKINNILNLNQSNQHYINKEQSINDNIHKQKYQNQEKKNGKNLNIQNQDKVDNEHSNAKSLSKVLPDITDENLIMTTATLQPKIFKDEKDEIATTKMYTIFENYNYDEELQNVDDLDIEQQIPIKRTTIQQKSRQIPELINNHDNEDDGNSTEKGSSLSDLNIDDNNQNVNNDNNQIEEDKHVVDEENFYSKNIDFETEPTNIKAPLTELAYDNGHNAEDKDDNLFQINRFKKDSNNDSMTFNSHRLFDNYDDIYLTQDTTPKEEENEDVEKEKEKSLNNENLLLNDTLKKFSQTSILATSKTKQDIVVKREGNDDADDDKDDSLDNLMLNDGLLPLNSHNGFVEMNYAQNLEDIDIVKLEQTHSTADELYKTINMTKEKTKEKSKKYKFKLNTTNYDKQKNEVISQEQKEEDKENNDIEQEKQVLYVKPVTSAPKLSPQLATSAPNYKTALANDKLSEKRIIVNLTIASNDGTGNMYSLHVNIPAFDQTGQVQDMQQVLTHEKLPIQQNEEQKTLNQIKQKENLEKEQDYKSSPYCLPEPPPPMPECPCACDIYTSTQSSSSLLTSSFEPDLDKDFNSLSSTSTPTSITTTPHSNTPAILHNDILENINEDFDNSLVSDATETTTTNMFEDDVVTDTLPTNIVMNSNKNGEKFACPDVVPVLILEGDLC